MCTHTNCIKKWVLKEGKLEILKALKIFNLEIGNIKTTDPDLVPSWTNSKDSIRNEHCETRKRGSAAKIHNNPKDIKRCKSNKNKSFDDGHLKFHHFNCLCSTYPPHQLNKQIPITSKLSPLRKKIHINFLWNMLSSYFYSSETFSLQILFLQLQTQPAFPLNFYDMSSSLMLYNAYSVSIMEDVAITLQTKAPAT